MFNLLILLIPVVILLLILIFVRINESEHFYPDSDELKKILEDYQARMEALPNGCNPQEKPSDEDKITEIILL